MLIDDVDCEQGTYAVGVDNGWLVCLISSAEVDEVISTSGVGDGERGWVGQFAGIGWMEWSVSSPADGRGRSMRLIE